MKYPTVASPPGAQVHNKDTHMGLLQSRCFSDVKSPWNDRWEWQLLRYIYSKLRGVFYWQMENHKLNQIWQVILASIWGLSRTEQGTTRAEQGTKQGTEQRTNKGPNMGHTRDRTRTKQGPNKGWTRDRTVGKPFVSINSSIWMTFTLAENEPIIMQVTWSERGSIVCEGFPQG